MKNNRRSARIRITGVNFLCALLAGVGIMANSQSLAATASSTANATVIESVSIVIAAPALVGTVVTIEEITNGLPNVVPLLHLGSGVLSGAVTLPVPVAGSVVLAGAVVPPAAVSAILPAPAATVSITRNTDGSLVVSGGVALTFAVSQPVPGFISIEYN